MMNLHTTHYVERDLVVVDLCGRNQCEARYTDYWEQDTLYGLVWIGCISK